MADSNDDPDLERAIALSMQEQDFSSTGQQKVVIDLDSDNDTPAVAVAQKSQQVDAQQATRREVDTMLGLDRKAMEAERLARKRKLASISPPPTRKAPKIAHSQRSDIGIQSLDKPIKAIPPAISASPIPKLEGLTFPRGAVKKTWAYNHARTGDDIKFDEVLQRSDLTLAVLSSYQWDFDWLVRKLDTRNTQMVFVVQAKGDSMEQEYLDDFMGIPNVRLCFPSMEGQVNCMHSKLMLLAHPGYLRIVVPTANLVPYDWGETGVMENSVYLIDLARLPKGQTAELEDMTFFGRELIHFLQAMGLDSKIVASIFNFDFSATKDIGFVHTIGGVHTDNAANVAPGTTAGAANSTEAWQRTGYCGLGRAVKKLGLDTDREIKVDYVTSSVGSLNATFLSTLYNAARGSHPPPPKAAQTTLNFNKTSKSKDPKPPTPQQQQPFPPQNFNIYYPLHSTVASSTGGTESGGTICFQSKWYDAPTFPRSIMRDCRSVRGGLLMHNKIIYVRGLADEGEGDGDETQDEDDIGGTDVTVVEKGKSKAKAKSWAYVGSANCSESAWGKLTIDRKTGKEKLACRNWECGVLIPVRDGSDGLQSKREEGGGGKGKGRQVEGVDSLDVFRGVVPVPMEFPGREYGRERPWFGMGS